MDNPYAFEYNTAMSPQQNFSLWRALNISERAAYQEPQLTPQQAEQLFEQQYGVKLGEGQ